MCGICGFVHFDPVKPVDRPLLGRMTEIMRHRGPDGDGYHTEPGAGLGVCRLNLIDSDIRDQPASNEDGSVTALCNGEIYNTAELRQELLAAGHRFRSNSDVEVIAHLYEDLGPDCVPRLRGMFGFALWDSRRRILMLARDRLGIKPLYYSLGTEGVCFASEIKPVLLSLPMRPRPNVLALQDLFKFGFVISSKTLFSGIHQLPPGHILLYGNGTATVRQYWQISFPAKNQRTPERSVEDWADALFEKMKESVRIHLRGDVPVGSWLSGGIDSSSMAALISRLTGRSVPTFSLTFEHPGFDEFAGQKTLDCFPEYRLLSHRILCTAKDFELFPKAVWHSENVVANALGILYMILARSTAQSLRVVVTGEGSDELFGGYGWYHLDKLFRPLAILPVPLRRLMLLGSLAPRLWPRASRVHVAPREMNWTRYQSMISGRPGSAEDIFSGDLRHEIDKAKSTQPPIKPPAEFDGWSAFTQLQYYDLTQRMPNLIAHCLESSTMAHSLEARVPFLDHELVEFCASIPPALKMRRFQEKYILRQAVRDLLPEPIVRRKKRGLQAPHEPWLRGKLPDFAGEMFSENKLYQKGYFDPPAVADVMKRFRAGENSCGYRLLGILAVQLWDELFMKDRLQEPSV